MLARSRVRRLGEGEAVGFYLRKGFNFGPLRLNVSRSGLGASFGVRGARVGVGPRGSYIHLGAGGLYYRQSLLPAGAGRRRRENVASEALDEVESGDVRQMIDASSSELLDELNRVHCRISLFPIAVTVLAILTAGLLAAPLLWATPAGGLAGEAALRPVPKAEVLRERPVAERRKQGPPAMWVWWFGAGLLVAGNLPLLAYLRHIDRTRGTAGLTYELEADAERQFARLVFAFDKFASCGAVWHVKAQGSTEDWKRNAGARVIVDRKAIRPGFSTPKRVACNIDVPTLPAGKETVYFFPDQVLVYTSSAVGAVAYRDLEVTVSETNFRETDPLPRDAEVTGSTWRFVAKSGGPDRRFGGNYEIPVVRYGELHLTSDSGLDELFQCSRGDVARLLAAAIKDLTNLCHKSGSDHAETSGTTPVDGTWSNDRRSRKTRR